MRFSLSRCRIGPDVFQIAVGIPQPIEPVLRRWIGYILEGDFRFKAGDEMLRVSTGGMAFGPRGTPHTFQNVGDTSGRLLVITTPSGLERFFEQFAELPPGQVDPQMIAALGHANWVEFIGPPLALSDPL